MKFQVWEGNARNTAQNINLIAHLLHTHSTGTKVKVHHYRNDNNGARELKPIADDKNYDYNFQELRLLKEPRQLKKVCYMKHQLSAI